MKDKNRSGTVAEKYPFDPTNDETCTLSEDSANELNSLVCPDWSPDEAGYKKLKDKLKEKHGVNSTQMKSWTIRDSIVILNTQIIKSKGRQPSGLTAKKYPSNPRNKELYDLDVWELSMLKARVRQDWCPSSVGYALIEEKLRVKCGLDSDLIKTFTIRDCILALGDYVHFQLPAKEEIHKADFRSRLREANQYGTKSGVIKHWRGQTDSVMAELERNGCKINEAGEMNWPFACTGRKLSLPEDLGALYLTLGMYLDWTFQQDKCVPLSVKKRFTAWCRTHRVFHGFSANKPITIELVEGYWDEVNADLDLHGIKQSTRQHPPKIDKWEDLTIEVIDDSTIRYKIGEKTTRATNQELGFWNNTKQCPNKPWETLLTLATVCRNNQIGSTSDSRNEQRSNHDKTVKNLQKDIDLICATLKDFFGPDDRPIPYRRKETCWRTLFHFHDARPRYASPKH